MLKIRFHISMDSLSRQKQPRNIVFVQVDAVRGYFSKVPTSAVIPGWRTTFKNRNKHKVQTNSNNRLSSGYDQKEFYSPPELHSLQDTKLIFYTAPVFTGASYMSAKFRGSMSVYLKKQ